MANRSVIVASIVVALAVCSCWADCPSKEASIPLDVDKFVGTWYLVAASPTSGSTVTNCSTLVVERRGDQSFKMTFTTISRHNGRPVKFFMQSDNDADITGTWNMADRPRVLGPFKHRVLEAVYDSYMSLIVCADDKRDIELKEFGMVLSREKTLSPSVVSESKTKIGTYVGYENIRTVFHDNCGTLLA